MLKDKLFRTIFNLQMFNEENPEGGSEGNPEGGDTPKDNEATSSKEKSKPFAIFPDEASFMSRLKREAKKMSENNQKELFSKLGVDSFETLQAIITEHNTKLENEKTELQKAQEKAQKLETAYQELLAKLENNTKIDTVKSIATELGVDEKRIARFMKLVDMNMIKIEDGAVTNLEAVKQSMSEILDEFPEFKGIESKGNLGGDFGGDNKDKTKLTMEDVKKMTTQQIQDNWAEVQKLLFTQ